MVVLASTTTRAASALQGIVGMLRVPPIVLLVEDPAAAWTAARPGGRAVRAVLGQDAGAEQISAAIECRDGPA